MQESSIVKCRDLMIGDWIQDEHGFRFYIVGIGEDGKNKLSSNLQGYHDRPDRHARTL